MTGLISVFSGARQAQEHCLNTSCVLLFSLRRADIFPGGDLALQHAVRLLYGLDARPDAAALTDFATRWAGHRGAAARLLWVYYNGEQSKNR